MFQRYELLPIDDKKLVVVQEQRPPRFDNQPLMENIIQERVQDRREGRFIVPQRVPEFTQLQERAARAENPEIPVRKVYPPNIQRLIGKRVSIYWPSQKKWFDGKVVDYSAGRTQHIVRYDIPADDGETDIFETLINSGRVKWRYLKDESSSDEE